MGGITQDKDSPDKILGATDDTEIGNIGDSLKVIGTDNFSSSVGVPVISPKLRFPFSESNITIPTAYVTIYSYTGSGKLFGAGFRFDSEEIEIKLTIDSNVIFEFTIAEIKDFDDINKGLLKGGKDVKFLGAIHEHNQPAPMAFTTEVKFEAKRSASTDRTMLRSAITISKET
jgi:hypothetical protein